MICKIKPVITSNEKENRTLMFAAKELQKYLSLVVNGEVPVIATSEYTGCNNVIFLGINLAENVPEVDNKELDDAIFIEVKSFSGIITGTNARSVLIAVYRFLKEKGFKFIRPGKYGEIIPDAFNEEDVHICEKASYRHRGVCIEGTVFQEQLADIIDWLPKAAMNEYFVQFRLPTTFLNGWYGGENPYRTQQKLTAEEVQSIMNDAESEIAKRNIIYHAVGHGWTNETIGIPGDKTDPIDYELSEEEKTILAMIDGKRELYNNAPLLTNLCYSNKDVRDKMCDNIVKYCIEHPNVDYLHFWLADANNNHCECENCRNTRPSDFYVKMLNDIDKKFTKNGISTKIVFLLYYDLMWKPLVEKFKNSERFTMMFAPISRSYKYSYDVNMGGEMKPFTRNKLVFAKELGESLEYLRDWQTFFNGDSFVFEYHFIWDHYWDFPQYNHAKVIHGDCAELEKIGLNGLISCQVQRVFTPTALGMNVLAENLWDKEKPFEIIEKSVLEAEFGDKWECVRNYLCKLSENSYADLNRKEAMYDFVWEEKFDISLEILADFEKEIKEGLNSKFKSNWEKLDFHNKLYAMMIEYVRNYDTPVAEEYENKIKDYVFKHEEKLRDVFDGGFFNKTFREFYSDLKDTMIMPT